MARCVCSRLLALLHSDPRLRTLPLAARHLWLMLAEFMANTGAPLPFAETRRVSLLVSAGETEVETHLKTLMEEGLLVATEGGGLAAPLLEAILARRSAGAENGRKGGRPRKGETREQYLARRQGELLMPVQGAAAAKPGETHAPEPAPPPPPSSTNSSLVTESPLLPRAREASATADLGRLGDAVMKAAGLVRPMPYTPLQELRDEGFTDAQIMAGVEARAGEPGYDPNAVNGLRFFRWSVARVAKRTDGPRVVAQQLGTIEGGSPYLAALQAWNAGGQIGPRPRREDFQGAAA